MTGQARHPSVSRRRQRGAGRRWARLLTIGLVLTASQSGQGRDDFGRWQGPLQDCRIEGEGRQGWSCRQLEVVQSSREVLSLRFWRYRLDREGQLRLQVVGTMVDGEGLNCNEQGCTLTPRLNLVVTGLNQLQMDDRGLATTIPMGSVASGRCQWLKRQLSCQIESGRGPAWTITARL